jgi:hypothetical protein
MVPVECCRHTTIGLHRKFKLVTTHRQRQRSKGTARARKRRNQVHLTSAALKHYQTYSHPVWSLYLDMIACATLTLREHCVLRSAL